jgi:type IV pilus assembly protein PilB
MAKGRGDFADILLKKKLISADQLAEAESIANATGIKLQD